MPILKSQRLRKSLALTVLLGSCLHAPPSELSPSHRLELRESASGPHGKGPFAVVAAGPRGEIEPGANPGLTLVFNRPLRRVDAPVDQGLPAIRVQTAEGQDVGGSFRFVGTRGLLFQPKAPLPGATRFRVTAERSTKALDGSSLAADYSFEFRTAVPALVAAFPASRPLRVSEPLYLQFSQPVEPAQLQKHLTFGLVVAGQAATRPLSVTIRRAAPGWLGRSTDPRAEEATYVPPGEVQEPTGKWLQIVPNAPLPLGSQFRLVIDAGLRSTEGPLATNAPIVVGATSFGPLYATNLKCAKQNLGRCQAHRDFTAVLSNPVHPDEFRRYLRIQGPPRRARPNSGAPTAAKKIALEHGLGQDPEFGDRFRITLLKGMSDVYGQKLEQDVTFELQVEEPFTKPIMKGVVQGRGDDSETGEVEATDVEPDVPRRPRLRYDLELGLTGHIVEASAISADARRRLPRVAVSAVNVPTYGLATMALNEWSTIQWLNDRAAPSAFRPFSWITPNAEKNIRSVRPLELGDALDHHPTGSALISLLGVGELESRDTLINVTDLAISARMSRLGSIVWVTRLSTGAAATGATVTVYAPDGKVVAQAATDAQGLATFSATELRPVSRSGGIDASLLLVARANDDYTYQRLEPARGATPDAGVDYAQKGNWVGLVFTDRSVYRPGETVKAGGLFRRTAEAGFALLPHEPFQYHIQDANWETVAIGEAELDAHGALAADITLSKSAALGRATLTVKLGRQRDETFSVPFELLAYKPAEFKVAVEATHRDAVHRQRATFQISAEYLFGAKLSEGKVTEHVSRQEVDFVPRKSTGYVVDDQTFLRDLRYSTNRGSAYLQEERTLDRNGLLSVTVPLDAPEQRRPELLTLEAEVRDLSAQTQSGRATVMVHPAEFYIGLKAPESRFFASGAALPVQVAAFRSGGERVAQVPVTVELMRRTWLDAIEDRPTDVLHHRTHVRDDKSGECRLSTEAGSGDCVLRLAEPGYYILRASAQDALGNRVYSSYGVYATTDRADANRAAVGWGKPDRRELELELDKAKYQPGDVAKVLLKSPFREGTALVTVERGGVLSSRVVTLRGEMPVVELPVLESYFPNAFVSVHLLRGRVSPRPEPGRADVGAPDYRIGYKELFVDPESRRLGVSITTPKPNYLPGEQVDAELSLNGKDGRPLSGTVTFYAVDEGVLRLTGYKTPDPLPAFASPRRLGVFALESRDELARFLSFRDGERINTLGFETADSSSDKGYEGGGGGELPGRLRSDFRTTVYFKAGQVVSKEKKAHFHFKLPDNLTSYRLMAVAAAEGDRFGFGETTIVASRPLMARPALPRHLRVGDRLHAGVIVTSKGLGEATVDVALKTQGVTLEGPKQQQVTLAAGGQAELRFPVKIERDGEASFEFGASTGAHTDRVRMTRKVEQPVRWLNATTYGTTDKSVAIALGDLRGARSDRGALQVTLSNSALVGLGSVFDSLSAYPYGCTEQLTSRVLPLLYAAKLAEHQKVRLPTGLREDVDALLGEIVKRVRPDGTVAFWDGENNGSPWLSAYALLALERGSQTQYFVPKRTRERIASQLTRILDASLSRGQVPDGDAEDATDDAHAGEPAAITANADFRERAVSPEETRRQELAQAVFVADVLARTAQLDEPRLRHLGSFQKAMALSSKIQLLHAMAQLRFPRQELDAALASLTKAITVGPAEARVESSDPLLSEMLESPTRSTALLLEATLAIDTKHPLAPKLARGLLKMRGGASYRNTQEEAWVLLALEEYRKAESQAAIDTSVEVFFGQTLRGGFAFRDETPKTETVTLPAQTLLASATSNLALVLDGKGAINYAVELKLAKDGLPEQPLDEGISVEKLSRPVDSARLTEVAKTIAERSESRARLGQLVVVDLLVETAESRDRVVVDDPIPAGFELVDFAFATTTQALSVAESTAVHNPYGRVPESSRYRAFRSLHGVHREMHDDRVLYYLPHLEPGIYHLRYLARATSPGDFVVPPTRAACMYDPEVFGQSRASRFEIASR